MRIFLNYRRDDTADAAGRLYDHLTARFGEPNVFMDIDAIEPGVDFAEVVNEAVQSCDVVLAIIGRQWLTAADDTGRRRVDDPDDFVRMELQVALESDVRVVPVLVQGVEMPSSDELPNALKKLARRNAMEMSHARWGYDIGRLEAAIEKMAGRPGAKDVAAQDPAERTAPETGKADREPPTAIRSETPPPAPPARAETQPAETRTGSVWSNAWVVWAFTPYSTWLAWLHAWRLTRDRRHLEYAVVYGLGLVAGIAVYSAYDDRAGVLILIGFWVAGLAHVMTARPGVVRQIEALRVDGRPVVRFVPASSPGTSRTSPTRSEGWYADPRGEARLRWWNGERWTDHTAT